MMAYSHNKMGLKYRVWGGIYKDRNGSNLVQPRLLRLIIRNDSTSNECSS